MYYQLAWTHWSLEVSSLASLLPLNISLLIDELFALPTLAEHNDIAWTVEAIKELICLYL